MQALEYFGRTSTLTEEGWMWFGGVQLSLGDVDFLQSSRSKRFAVCYDSPALYRLLAFAYRSQNDLQAERDALENQFRLDKEGMFTPIIGLVCC